jgi:hypothetical protein
VTLESYLYYITHHSESIIQWLFLAILLMAAFVIARAIFGKKEPAAAAAGIGLPEDSDIHSFLEKILEQTKKLEAVPLAGINPKAMGEVEAQLQMLKKDLQTREEELNNLKATAGNSKATADAGNLSARIKELETKLSEYEILEDDIADLSLYKEENLRLRSELEKNKGGAPAAATPAPAQVPASGEDIVAEFAHAVSQDVPPATAAEIQMPETGNPMADFESAVKSEKKTLSEPKTMAAAQPAAVASITPRPAAPVAAPALPSDPTEGDDLFAEFATPTTEPADGAPLDTDKMMAEMAALVNIEPSKDTALDDEIDTEKMALEATTFSKK